MAGFTAINIGMRIPGMVRKLKQLADLPLQLVMASADSSEDSGIHWIGAMVISFTQILN